jgi:hypothetical protein
MCLLGTAGTSCDGATLHRKFTTIRADGSYATREATLEQDNIHEVYRKYFNALDKHNSIRQGGACFESTWKTHRWWVREFQMLWGISEVNAWLLYKIYKPGMDKLSFSDFRRELCLQIFRHPKILRDRELRARALADDEDIELHGLENLGRNEGGHLVQRTCAFCPKKTSFYCPCTQGDSEPGIYLCNPASGRDCFKRHCVGEAPENRKSKALRDRWQRRRDEKEARAAGRGRRREGRGLRRGVSRIA